ncbi:MAG: hypothetical protein ACMUIE_07815 [Thermoplasmatota archaeon]
MRSIRLADRWQGSEFCTLERMLIFDQSYRDTGYVRYLDHSSFTLRKSRFTDIDSGKVYVLPGDMMPGPDEGAFIQVETGGSAARTEFEAPRGGTSRDFRTRTLSAVEDFKEAKVPLPPPAIPMDEFLHRASSDWRNAGEDMLDIVIGLLMVSAPFSIYGKGGLGSEGFEGLRTPSSGTVKDVTTTVVRNLAVEFRTTGTEQYRYRTVDSLKGLLELQRDRVREECFSITRPGRITPGMRDARVMVQLPFVIKDAELTSGERDFDLDILDYQLTALYMPPPSEKAVEEVAVKILKDAFNESFFDLPGIGEPDPMAAVKLGLGISRLHVGRQFTGSGYSRMRTDIGKGKELLTALLKRGYEEIRLKMKEEELLPLRKEHPWRSRLKPMDRRIYLYLRELMEQQGIQEIPRDRLMPDEDRRMVEESLERLNRYGYVLFMMNGLVVKAIISSSPEDEA